MHNQVTRNYSNTMVEESLLQRLMTQLLLSNNEYIDREREYYGEEELDLTLSGSDTIGSQNVVVGIESNDSA